MARHKSKDMETILAVYSTKDAESASLALLKADVECVRRKIGAGKYGNFLLSLNNYGEEICVDPRDKEKAKDDQPTQTTAAMKYVAGVYTTPITLNDNAIDVEVVVDQDHINSIRLVNLSDTVTTMYPLVQPALEEIASQIYDTQSTDGITYSQDSKYTSQILLDAIDSALETAQVKTEEE